MPNTGSSAIDTFLASASIAAMRTNLGLVIGTDVQAYNGNLSALGGLTSAANKGIQFTGAGTASTYDLTSAGKALLDDADAAAQRVTIGLAAIANGEVIGWADAPIARSAANRFIFGTAGPVLGTGGLLLQTSDTLGWSDATLTRLAAGSIGTASRLTVSVNGTVSAPPASLTGTWFTGGTATTTKPAFLLEPTGTTSTAWSTSGTGLGVNAPSGFAGNLIDAQVAGASRLKLGSTGEMTLTGPDGTKFLDITDGFGNVKIQYGKVSATGVFVYADLTCGYLCLGLNNDTFLHRDAAGVSTQRNGTNAQAFRIYGTYTDASNYRRLGVSSTTAGVFSIAPSGAGTGASGNVLHISGLPTSNPGPGILWDNAGTPAIGT